MIKNSYLSKSAYDADEIKSVSKKLGHVPVIDPNPRQSKTVDLPPAQKIRYRERTTGASQLEIGRLLWCKSY